MISETQLQTLSNFYYNDLIQKSKEHALEWNKAKKCSCVVDIENPTYETMRICEHIEKEQLKIFKKEYERSNKIFSLLACLKWHKFKASRIKSLH